MEKVGRARVTRRAARKAPFGLCVARGAITCFARSKIFRASTRYCALVVFSFKHCHSALEFVEMEISRSLLGDTSAATSPDLNTATIEQ